MDSVAQKYRIIDRHALKAKLDGKETFHLWNVLKPESYKPESNIPGSKWVPVDRLTETFAAEKARKDSFFVVYCAGPTCTSSRQAAEGLLSLGCTNVSIYEGGLKDWSEAGFPLVKL